MTAEQTDGSGFPIDPKTDPELVNLTQTIAKRFVEARGQSPEQWADLLNKLSGRAIVAITGTVYVPRLSRAFGDWILLPPESPTGERFEIIGEEQIDTQPPDPFIHRGHESYTVGQSYVRGGKVVVIAEQDFEDGEPRIFYPEELNRFELLRVRPIDIFTRREIKHDQRLLRFLLGDSQS